MHLSRTIRATIAVAIAILALPAVSQAAKRAPIKDCGDITTLDNRGGGFLGAITAQGGSCKNARAVAASTAKSAGCKSKGFCQTRSYHCTLVKLGKELTTVRCENGTQTAFIRFEFGS
jgi:hypothetical protein